MADDAADQELYWYDPDMRGQLSITDLHVPHSLKKLVRKHPFDVRIDTAFTDVITACAESTKDRPSTWINDVIWHLFIDLHEMGFAHSVECWKDDELVGGLYGLAIGGAFFGESMFSRQSNASKIALVHLVARLRAGGFTLLDTQYVNDHLKQFAVYEVSRADYHEQLAEALKVDGNFYPEIYSVPSDAASSSGKSGGVMLEDVLVEGFLQSMTQTS